MKRISMVILTVLFLFSINTLTRAEWTQKDTILTVLEVIDWKQTLNIATEKNICHVTLSNGETIEIENGYKYYENNPLLGKHPKVNEVNIYFATCMLINYLVAKYGSDKLHNFWVNSAIGIDLMCVSNNCKIGIKCKF